MRLVLALAAPLLLLCSLAHAAPCRPPRPHPVAPVQHGAVVGGQTRTDTVYVLGGPDRWDGRFEDPDGAPNWHGWTHRDLTYDDGQFWSISDHLPLSGPYSMWCGTVYDDGPGYGNDWDQRLVFTHTVTTPADGSEIQWTGLMRTDTERNYDYVYLEVNRGGTWEVLASYDGAQNIMIDQDVVLATDDHAGDDQDEIQLAVHFTSDGAYSDEDGLHQTQGACWLDELVVRVDGVVVSEEDFDDQDPGPWQLVSAPGVGDFAQLWVGLYDLDPCLENRSAQVAFIDDGLVVPGTGGSMCQTWCYGPGGYIVNNTGGLLGPGHYLQNTVESPVYAWPSGYDGAELRADVYRHEELGDAIQWPGMTWSLAIRSVGTESDIADASYQTREFFRFGGPDYIRARDWVSDFLAPDCAWVQMRFEVREIGYYWGWVGTDGTPAPYFDNAAIVAWRSSGPEISGRAIDWFQDSFPASGTLDLVDLGANSVRVDAARDIAWYDDLVNDPGDSMWFDAMSPRTQDNALAAPPVLSFRVRANPLFDPYRILPSFTITPGYFADGWSLIEGSVPADSCFTSDGYPIAHRWSVDLPDSFFFYPGDVLHWYVEARDEVDGDVGVAILPADTAGFASFDVTGRYPTDHVMRALPTITDASGTQPSLLFWNDATGRGGDDEWFGALQQLGYEPGIDYDLYTTNGPSSGVGNGLGGRAVATQLAGYGSLLYTCADIAHYTLSNGDGEADPSDDLGVLWDWFALGGRNALFTGDSFVSSLQHADGQAFLADYLPTTFEGGDLRPLVDQQTAPRVLPTAGNGILTRVDQWIAYGGCPRLETFDAVIPAGNTVALAEFTDAAGNAGAYPFAAAAYHHRVDQDARVIVLPYDFMRVHNDPGWTPPAGYEGIPARAILLEDVLAFFGETGTPPPVGAPPAAGLLQVSCHPNPFNPQVTFSVDLPRSGDVAVTIHDLRGAVIRRLVHTRLEAGRHELAWDGRDDRGGEVASGVYLAETQAAGQVVASKLALIR